MKRCLLETDQIQCYAQEGQSIPCEASGQDASFEKRGDPSRRQRFRSSSHTVVDESTGAVWSRDANPAEYPLTWQEALSVWGSSQAMIFSCGRFAVNYYGFTLGALALAPSGFCNAGVKTASFQ